MNTTQDNTATDKAAGSQSTAWFRFALIVLVSVGSYLWVHHYRQVFDSIVEAHMGSNTYMVPLLAPVRWRLGLGEGVSTTSFFYAAELRHHAPRFAALAVFVFSIVALVATISSSTT